MITIYSCNPYSKKLCEYGNYRDKIGLSNAAQWKYIKSINRQNGCIATLPHKDSALRKYFIEPHLDKDGYVIEGKYKLKLHNFIIYYEIVKDNEIPKNLEFNPNQTCEPPEHLNLF